MAQSIVRNCLSYFWTVGKFNSIAICMQLMVFIGTTAHGLSACAQEVFATVGVEEITQAEIDFHLGRPAGSKPLPVVVRENTVHLIAQQRRALQTLRKTKQASSLDEVHRWAVENFGVDDGVENGEQILARIAKERGVSPATVQDHLAFRMSWKQYLAKHLVAKNLVRHFQNQRQRFDGTKFKIRMVSLPVPAGDSAKRDAASEKLKTLRGKLGGLDVKQELSGELAEGFDVLKLREVRGIGDIDHRAIDAALKLKPGEWSPVFHSATGVHLLGLVSREEGNAELDEVRGEVRIHMLVFLLESLSTQSEKDLEFRARVK